MECSCCIRSHANWDAFCPRRQAPLRCWANANWHGPYASRKDRQWFEVHHFHDIQIELQQKQWQQHVELLRLGRLENIEVGFRCLSTLVLNANTSLATGVEPLKS